MTSPLYEGADARFWYFVANDCGVEIAICLAWIEAGRAECARLRDENDNARVALRLAAGALRDLQKGAASLGDVLDEVAGELGPKRHRCDWSLSDRCAACGEQHPASRNHEVRRGARPVSAAEWLAAERAAGAHEARR